MASYLRSNSARVSRSPFSSGGSVAERRSQTDGSMIAVAMALTPLCLHEPRAAWSLLQATHVKAHSVSRPSRCVRSGRSGSLDQRFHERLVLRRAAALADHRQNPGQVSPQECGRAKPEAGKDRALEDPV